MSYKIHLKLLKFVDIVNLHKRHDFVKGKLVR